MDRGTKQTFYQKRHTNDCWKGEKVHQTTVRYHRTPIRMAVIKKMR